MAQRRKSAPKQEQSTGYDTAARFICYRCGRAFSRYKSFFLASHSPMYRSIGYLPVCRDCSELIYNKYVEELKSERAAMRRFCMKFDLYWHDSLFDMVEKQENVRSYVTSYVGKTNMSRYVNKDFDDTLREEAEAEEQRRTKRAIEIGVAELDEDDDIVEEHSVRVEDYPPNCFENWGKGYDLDFYIDLERRYNKYTAGREDIPPNEESMFRQVCLLEAQIARDGAAGKPIKDNIATLNTVLGSLKLKPVQQKDDADSSLDKIPFGVGIKWCEDKRPIPEVDPQFKDQDGIVRYITTWLYGHLVKMAGKKDWRSQLYEEEVAKMRMANPDYDDVDDEEFLADVLAEVGDDE